MDSTFRTTRARRFVAALAHADHKAVALAYVLTALLMLLSAFGLVLLMRWQLAYPGVPLPLVGGWFADDHVLLPGGAMDPNFYNQLGAMHGTMMVFLAVVPLLVGGLGSYLVPLMLGAGNLAFPSLSRWGYLSYLAGVLVLGGSFIAPTGPTNSGWTGYAPLAVIETGGQTWWLIGLGLVYFSSLALSVNLITTIVQLRAPGLGFFRMPYFVWAQLITAVLLLLAFPPLAAAAVLQLSDRLAGTSFFLPSGLVISGTPLDVAGEGSALLWQHLFWFLAHPEVYVLILPAIGIVAEVICANARRPLWGYRIMVYATLFLGLMSLIVWAHHMFLTGMATVLSTFFQVTTIIISVPSVILSVCVFLTLWGGSIRFTPPMLFALAFLPMFALGGLTGLPLAMAATNVPLHDTYYVVGHFHFIVAPGTLFAVFAAIYHWFPKVTGRRMNPVLAHLHFWPSLLFMIGIFGPMMLSGLAGVSRRLYDGGASYAHGQEAQLFNVMSTHSAFALAAVQVFFIANFLASLRYGRKMAENPWDATTLEWTAPSPPLARGNFNAPPSAYRGPYEYSPPGRETGFIPQAEPESAP